MSAAPPAVPPAEGGDDPTRPPYFAPGFLNARAAGARAAAPYSAAPGERTDVHGGAAAAPPPPADDGAAGSSDDEYDYDYSSEEKGESEEEEQEDAGDGFARGEHTVRFSCILFSVSLALRPTS
jgi:hypothetical protein